MCVLRSLWSKLRVTNISVWVYTMISVDPCQDECILWSPRTHISMSVYYDLCGLTLPNCSKYFLTSSRVDGADRPPTKIFFVRVTIWKETGLNRFRNGFKKMSQPLWRCSQYYAIVMSMRLKSFEFDRASCQNNRHRSMIVKRFNWI